MEDEKVENGIKRKEDGTFDTGTIGGPGRPPDTEQDKIVKKATKQLIAEYKEALGESLPLITPVLIAKALEGDMPAIKELNDRVMGKAEQHTDITTGGLPIIQVAEAIVNKNVTPTSSPEQNS